MKVWVTKHALTKGVFSCEAAATSFTDMVRVEGFTTYVKPDWHETEIEAIKRAKEMCVAKIGSLKKTLKRTQKLTFEVTK